MIFDSLKKGPIVITRNTHKRAAIIDHLKLKPQVKCPVKFHWRLPAGKISKGEAHSRWTLHPKHSPQAPRQYAKAPIATTRTIKHAWLR